MLNSMTVNLYAFTVEAFFISEQSATVLGSGRTNCFWLGPDISPIHKTHAVRTSVFLLYTNSFKLLTSS